MAILKCKMCGGTLEIIAGTTVCECEYCGSMQTIPKVDDEKINALFNRANILRMKAEFDKAAEIYEKIILAKEDESEAYWGLVLCEYGIEYVEDPATYKRVPTCHRSSYDSIVANEDYKNAIKHADMTQKQVYEEEAKAIDEIQKGIIALAQKEEPYDIFICYKESDESGKRTQDSVIANDIYHQLTHEGYKVFYAAISLEDKLGKEYEPYIFSALSTAKVMLALGTKPEYFNAVWVKNEWSRFLKLMKNDRSRLLIPCYRDMDPYELPEEFAHLQAQDMSKIGFINDIVRGIKKVVKIESDNTSVKENVTSQNIVGRTTSSAQVKRGNMALEDHDWEKADDFFEEALNLDPECGEAYIGKLLAREEKTSLKSWTGALIQEHAHFTYEKLEACPADTNHIEKMATDLAIEDYLDEETIKKPYEFDRSYKSLLSCRKAQKREQIKAIDSDKLLARTRQYVTGENASLFESCIKEVVDTLDNRIEEAKRQDEENIARVKKEYTSHVKQVDEVVTKLHYDAESRRESRYEEFVAMMNSANGILEYDDARLALLSMKGYKDTKELAASCQNEINRLRDEQFKEEQRLKEKQREEKKIAAERKKKLLTKVAIISLVVLLAFSLLYVFILAPMQKYDKACADLDSKKYKQAIDAFIGLGDYKDSKDKLIEADDMLIDEYFSTGNRYKEVEPFILKMEKSGDPTIRDRHKDDLSYCKAMELLRTKHYDDAEELLGSFGDFRNSRKIIESINTVRRLPHKIHIYKKIKSSSSYEKTGAAMYGYVNHKTESDVSMDDSFDYSIGSTGEIQITSDFFDSTNKTITFGNDIGAWTNDNGSSYELYLKEKEIYEGSHYEGSSSTTYKYKEK